MEVDKVTRREPIATAIEWGWFLRFSISVTRTQADTSAAAETNLARRREQSNFTVSLHFFNKLNQMRKFFWEKHFFSFYFFVADDETELPPLRTTTVLAPRLPVWTHLPPPSTTTTTTWTPPALHEVLTERKEGKPTIRPSVHDLTEALPSGGDGHGGRMTSVKATTLRPRHTTSNSSPNLFTRTPFHHNIIMILLLLVALVSFHSSS